MHPHRNRRQRRKDVRCGRRKTKGCDNRTVGVGVVGAVLLLVALAFARIVEGFAERCPNSMRFAVHPAGGDPFGGTPWRYNGVGKTAQHHDEKHLLLRRSMASRGGDGDGITATREQQTQREIETKKAIEGLMTEHDPILLFASKLLPRDKAADASALYAWCRRLDEICDNEEYAVGSSSGNNSSLEPVRDQLDQWQQRFEALWVTTEPDENNNNNNYYYAEDEYLMDLALKACIEKYQGDDASSDDDDDGTSGSSLLTRIPFDDMIEGMKSDAVEGRRIQTMEELELYAYRVAGTVGLMLLPLLLSETNDGNNGNVNRNGNGNDAARERTLRAIEKAREPAICLGKAIQLVNILRDATQDAKLGRIYLPQDMLTDEGVNDDTILAVALNLPTRGAATATAAPDGYKNVVKTVSGRALELLAMAETGKDTLPSPLGPLFVQIIVELYRDYLDELDRRGYDNLSSGDGGEDRVKISTLRKAKASLRAFGKVGREFLFGSSGAVVL